MRLASPTLLGLSLHDPEGDTCEPPDTDSRRCRLLKHQGEEAVVRHENRYEILSLKIPKMVINLKFLHGNLMTGEASFDEINIIDTNGNLKTD